jgi:hypothetical protein
VCWEYVFVFDDSAFIQQGTEENPVVYWLSLTALPTTPPERWMGWKTSSEHWNDGAVWTPYPGGGTWNELRYPQPHPFAGESIDLAFAIFGPACDAIIGDANATGAIDIDDVVYLIAYVFSAGMPPAPYPVASGDSNCDCTVDIDDIVYEITFIFSGGPAPCSCAEWMAACGPLR